MLDLPVYEGQKCQAQRAKASDGDGKWGRITAPMFRRGPGHLVRFPHWQGSQLVLGRHGLQKGQDCADFPDAAAGSKQPVRCKATLYDRRL